MNLDLNRFRKELRQAQSVYANVANPEDNLSWWYYEGRLDAHLNIPEWNDFVSSQEETKRAYLMGRADAEGDIMLREQEKWV